MTPDSKVYLTPKQKIRQRYNWFLEAQSVGNVSLACKRLGISRKTFYKWKQRFERAHQNRSALLDHSHRPYHCPRSVKRGLRRRILELRRKTRLGPLRLLQLLQNHGLKHLPSAPTIAKIIKRNGLTRRLKAKPKRYRRGFIVPRPGDLIQIDIKFVPYLVEGRRLYQYTATMMPSSPIAILLALKHPWIASLSFTPLVLTAKDWGPLITSFPPRTIRLNGKVEQSHPTDEEEFYRLHATTHDKIWRKHFTDGSGIIIIPVYIWDSTAKLQNDRPKKCKILVEK